MQDSPTARKLLALERALAELRSLGHITPADLAADWRMQRAVERDVLILVDVVVEVCQRVAGNAGQTRLPSVGDAVARCVRLGALSAEVNYVGLVRLANFPVYRYEAIEAGLLVEMVNEKLDDFARFRDDMTVYLGRR
jgi:uncharacterized protein YutE (UPF0331/DUF86 family)